MSAQVTEAHLTLADQVQQGFFTMARRLEVAQLIADSEAKATAELKKRADHWCDMHTVCAKEANQLRAELATCKDASEALVESLRAEVERLRECCDQTSALCGKFITEDDGTDLIPNSARIANALARLKARADRAEAELAGIRALANRRNKRDHSQDTTHQLVAALDQALDIAQAELATERAKYNQLLSALVYADQILDDIDTCSDAHKPMYSSYSQNVFKLCIKGRDARRAAIDAAMKEETK